MDGYKKIERKQTIIIGGGQAGLSVGYHLKKQGIPFRILDANPRVGDAWRKRWDSLKLFTTARYTGLAGLPFPAGASDFPTKDQMADYLEAYAKHFQLPVENGVKVDSLSKVGDLFVMTAGNRVYQAEQVVIAMSNYQEPRTPEFASDLEPNINQMHSYQYRNPSQLKKGDVLIVGAGNSAADIAIELSKTHRTWMAGKESGYVPFPIESFLGRHILGRVVRFVFHYILSLGSPIGRRRYQKLLHGHAPLVRVKPKELIEAGVERVPRVVAARDGHPMLADDRVLDVANVIWCTGFDPGFSWIKLPIFGDDGLPKHKRGVVESVPGLYFVGLHFLYALSSATLMGIGRDARFIAEAVITRTRATASVNHPIGPASTRNGRRPSSVRIRALSS
jgi:putative flavoprotein involved in K+ transport